MGRVIGRRAAAAGAEAKVIYHAFRLKRPGLRKVLGGCHGRAILIMPDNLICIAKVNESGFSLYEWDAE